MPKTEAQKRATANYRKKMKSVTISFSPNESGIWDYLDAQPNKSGFIKRLIREDMERNDLQPNS